MMSLTFGLFIQVSGSGPLGPLVFVFYEFTVIFMGSVVVCGVVCGSLWWSVVVCGSLWWSVVFSASQNCPITIFIWL